MKDRLPTPIEERWWPRRFLNRLEVDRAVFYAVLARAWQLLAGPVTVVLIAWNFSRPVQGYYYTFWSMIALQMCFETSFHQVIINFASHEWEKLSLGDDGAVQGDADALSRLQSLLRWSLTWYGVAALVFFVVVSAAGLVFFASGEFSESLVWRAPWITLVALTAMTFWTVPCLGMLEGCQQVKSVYKLQFVRAVVGNLVVWTSIALGAALWTPALIAAARLLCEFILISGPYRKFFGSLLARPAGPSINWKLEVWPFQWRLGIKGFVAYLNSAILQLFFFYYFREVVAGQFGMTWQILNAFQMASASWYKTRTAKFGLLVSQKKYAELDRIYYRLVAIALVMVCLGSLAFCGFIASSGYIESKYIDYFTSRVLTPLPTAILAIGLCLVVIPESQWIYIHAHKRSPYLLLTVVGALANGLCVWVLGREFGALGVAVAYTGMIVCFYLPVWTWVWLRCRREWHDVDL